MRIVASRGLPVLLQSGYKTENAVGVVRIKKIPAPQRIEQWWSVYGGLERSYGVTTAACPGVQKALHFELGYAAVPTCS
jgi:hypothetical protein